MKKLILILLITFSNFISANDVILINDGSIIQGEILKFANNRLMILTNEGTEVIKNSQINLIAISQNLTEQEKFLLGKLDGKRYAKNKGGNLILGLLTGLIGTAIVYVSSEQMPSLEASLGANKKIVDDPSYISGFTKGAKIKSTSNAFIGTLIWVAYVLASG